MAFESRSEESLSQINVTPLVDVMLVLLVIFMVTAPILHQGVTVQLPRAQGATFTGDDTQLVVSVTEAGDVFLNDTKLSAPELRDKLAAVVAERPDCQVFLRADADVRYGVVVTVLAALREAGVQHLGMVTKPVEGG